MLDENRGRGKHQPEFELIDTGIFDDNRYFDIFVEYAKAASRRYLDSGDGSQSRPEPAALHVLPQLWFRNTWSWAADSDARQAQITARGDHTIWIEPSGPGRVFSALPSSTASECCSAKTRPIAQRLFGTEPVDRGYFKDAFHDYVVRGEQSAVNPRGEGTKAALCFSHDGGGRWQARSTAPSQDRNRSGRSKALTRSSMAAGARPTSSTTRLQRAIDRPRRQAVQRQAFAGMIWSKQFYHYDVPRWLDGDPLQPRRRRSAARDETMSWTHLNNADIVSMPDKWEYPWYAAWDLAFHCIPLALIDPEFAKEQLVLFTREWYMHPSGQLPAYEWELGDVNPPVHAWAAWRVFQIDRKQRGDCGDLAFLERVLPQAAAEFHLVGEPQGRAGPKHLPGRLPGPGQHRRLRPQPTAARRRHLDQADATGWMAMYCLNLMRIALELAIHNPVYQDIATKFFEHFLGIAAGHEQHRRSRVALWDEADQFFYDKLIPPMAALSPCGCGRWSA